MTWETMAQREPELTALARIIIQARQAGATFSDWWTEHHEQLGRLVGFGAESPVLRNDKAYRVARTHLLQVWVDTMSEGSVKLPWDSRPLGVER